MSFRSFRLAVPFALLFALGACQSMMAHAAEVSL